MTVIDEGAYRKLAEADLENLIHPQHYSPDHQEPVIFDHGKGVWLTDVKGKSYIDGLSSLWNVAVGHGREELADAAANQIRKVAFTNNYTGYSNVPAIELASKVISLTYENMGGVFFTNSGSESNEGAFKTARFYWNLKGKPEKTKLIARERAYHGGTLATSTMTGLPPFWKYFGPLVPNIVHTRAPENPEDSVGEPNSDGEYASWIEDSILREGPETVAAVICEPVKGAGGVWTPSESYFREVREICDKYDVLLIADEVITGFGRTGNMFALERWNVQPDILSIAKAITSGYIPMGAFIVSREIRDALKTVPADAKFMHAYTNSAHPTASAVGLRNLQIIEDENLVANAQSMGDRFGAGLHAIFDDHPHVTNIRHLGLIAGFSAVSERDPDQGYDAGNAIGVKIQTHMREEGSVITRIVGDNVLFAPPLCVNQDEIDQMLDAVKAAVDSVTLT